MVFRISGCSDTVHTWTCWWNVLRDSRGVILHLRRRLPTRRSLTNSLSLPVARKTLMEGNEWQLFPKLQRISAPLAVLAVSIRTSKKMSIATFQTVKTKSRATSTIVFGGVWHTHTNEEWISSSFEMHQRVSHNHMKVYLQELESASLLQLGRAT